MNMAVPPINSLILVYNRDILTQLLLFEHLKEKRNLIVVTNLKEIKPIIENRPIRLILAEINEEDFQYWRNLRDTLPNPKPKVLGLCSLTLPQYLLNDLGLDDQIVKPIDLDELDQKII